MSATPRVDNAQSPALPRPVDTDMRESILRTARLAGPDPFDDHVAEPTGWRWHYAYSAYEVGALQRVVSEGHETNRSVDYVDNFATPIGFLRLTGHVLSEGVLRLRAAGAVEVSHGDVTRTADAHETSELVIDGLAVGDMITATVHAGAETAALGVATDRGSATIDWCVGVGDDSVTSAPRVGDERPPHTHGEAEVSLSLSPLGGGVYALPAPAMGRLEITADHVTSLTTGESLEEALADSVFSESHHEIDDGTTEGFFVSRHRLGLQFARIEGTGITDVRIAAAVRPARTRGAFASSDPRLNQIWATAAYTLRLCMQTFLIDGIKRDRMPWLGDHALGVLTNAYAFADRVVIRDTLTALGRPRHGYINGIADYSLWWVISHGLYQAHFDDADYLLGEADHIDRFLDDLASHTDPSGVFRPIDLPDSFQHTGPGSLFLDWGVQLRGDHDSTAVQIMWKWALASGASVLRKAGHPGATRWQELAERVESLLRARGWSAAQGRWRDYLDVDGSSSAYPNFLAVLADVDPPAHTVDDARADTIAANAAGTPFMRAFALLSLGSLGRSVEAVCTIRELWGRMLDAGARTFWEEFGSADSSPYEMYRRPFGKSLCHAWSAGPAALLPRLVLGVQPLADGWRHFSVSPTLGDLDWAGCVVPTPHGEITVLADTDGVTVDIPAGASLIDGGAVITGPQIARLVL